MGRRAAELAGAAFVDLDLLIERDSGRSIPDIFQTQGEAGFRACEAARLRDSLTPGAIIAVGGGTPMNEASWRLMRERAITVWLDAPLEELLRRADATTRPMLQGRSADEVEDLYLLRARRYGEADHRLDGTGSVEDLAREVARLWEA
ncbi:MAG: shikimate kinase [Candidatus Dormibacteraeota bacterium]|nr:shikimate kinase [Candidatus Dormibacteraeota bacterium]MBO0745244.1 shikimate kinase [Candidatus Dormibacteraeota bacterium]